MGGHVEVPTPDGPVTIEVPAGTQNGQRFRLRKRGVPRPGDGGRGDLWVEARVVIPAVTDDRGAGPAAGAAPRSCRGAEPMPRGRRSDDGDAGGRRRPSRAPARFYMISVVSKAYGIHPQTLRLYEREGLLKPSRTDGNTRLYSEEDLRQLEVILNLTRDLGVNLAGRRDRPQHAPEDGADAAGGERVRGAGCARSSRAPPRRAGRSACSRPSSGCRRRRSRARRRPARGRRRASGAGRPVAAE